MIFPHNLSGIGRFRLSLNILLHVSAALLFSCSFFAALSPAVHAQGAPVTKYPVTIVLPPKLVAGQPATLAVLDSDGRLAPGITVDLGDNQSVTTDITGRAYFTAPSQGSVMFAKVLGIELAAIVEPALPGVRQGIVVRQFISQRDHFSICGAQFRGDADANSVRLNNDPALILAASPECLVVLAGPKATLGPAQIAIDAGTVHASASTSVVSLESELAIPPLTPGKKSNVSVRVEGSDAPLAIVVENKTPGVLRFLSGDVQTLRTSGGTVNRAQIDVETIRSGDFSIHARLAPVPDTDAARRYLEAAAQFAPQDSQRTIKKLADRVTRHQADAEKVRRELDKILSSAITGDSRALLEAARAAL